MKSEIERILDLKYPIYWNEWAIEPAVVRLLVYEIIATRPKNIVELGGGLSTLIMAKTLKTLGYRHHIMSIDSDSEFLNETKNILRAENVYDDKVTDLIFADLKKQRFDGEEYNWYSPEKIINIPDKIDLLFVDGPVGSINKNSRYPAVPFFIKNIKSGTKILLDDAKREDEKEIINQWTDILKNVKVVNRADTVRGIAEIIKV